ncbi:MAG TPA: hypothetical protein VGP96_15770 [Candidatus Dormibacteraeota bacterium]|nr:hypothetical protein [Candidatus Dormibacteraeota bacterium]
MRVALWGAFDAPDGELLATRRVLEEGLRRRLPGCRVTALSPAGTPLAADGGRPAERLPGPAELAERFDCLVTTGAPAPELESTLPVVDAGSGDGRLPPPAILLPRLLDPGLLRRRAELLRLLGWTWPAGGRVTVEGDASLLGAVEGIAAALLPLVESGAVAVQLAASGSTRGEDEFASALETALGGSCRRVPDVAALEDLVAVVAGSAAYAGPPGLGLWAALALGVPAATLAGPLRGGAGDLLAGLAVPRPTPAELCGTLAALLGGDAGPPRAEAAMAAMERHLDGLAERVAEAAGGRPRPAPGAADLTDEELLQALRTAHEARGRQLFAERHAAQAALDGALAEARAEVDRLRSELAAARAANDQMVASRTWRYTQPVRDTLARVRERRR